MPKASIAATATPRLSPLIILWSGRIPISSDQMNKNHPLGVLSWRLVENPGTACGILFEGSYRTTLSHPPTNTLLYTSMDPTYVLRDGWA